MTERYTCGRDECEICWNVEKAAKNAVKTQNLHNPSPITTHSHSIDSTAIYIGSQINLSPNDFPDKKAFYDAIIYRIEGKKSFTGQMLYMVNLTNQLS